MSDDVTRRNFEAVRARGFEALEAVLRDLRRDRDESYARIQGASRTGPGAHS